MSSVSPASSGLSSSPVYQERVTPSVGWWTIVLFLSAMTSLLVFPVSKIAAVITPLIVGALVVVAMRRLSTRIVVTDMVFIAGQAHIERTHITGATAHDPEESFAQRGHLLDVRAFLVLRPWVKTVVRVEIADPADPTPYWLVTTRHPRALAEALTTAPQQ